MAVDHAALGRAQLLLEADRADEAEAVCRSAFGAGGPAHFARLRFLVARARDPATVVELRALDQALAAMDAEIARQPLYVASEFWSFWGRYHVELLRRYGMGNFKRTVSHNYQNWLIASIDDPQFRSMLSNWPRHASAQPLLNRIEVPSHVGYHDSRSFEVPEYVLAYAEPREIYKLAVGLIWEFVGLSDRAGWLGRLSEVEIGNPVRIQRRDRLISADLAHSVRERNMLVDRLGLTGGEGLCIGELGAGYGRLAEVFGRTTNYRYVVFDIPPALYVAQWYIQKLFPGAPIFAFRPFASFAEIADELARSRIAFFTANQIETFPDGYFDAFINMNSLMEMRREQIVNFIGQIDRLTRRAFLSRQWLKWRNAWDAITVEKNDFALGGAWRLALDVVDEIHPGLFNHLWVKG
jgi:putative sugar O-methyltransferase